MRIALKEIILMNCPKTGKRKVQGVPRSQTAALPRHQEEEETDKSKQAQTEQTYEKQQRVRLSANRTYEKH